MSEVAMNVETPTRYVATKLDEAPQGALSVLELAEGYVHPNPGDESRVPAGCEPPVWFVEQGLAKLGDQVSCSGDRWSLTREFDKLRYNGKKLHRHVMDAGLSLNDVRAMQKKAAAAQVAKDNGHPSDGLFTVDVVGPRGGKVGSRTLTLHELAFSFPPLGDAEFLQVAQDIKKKGVLVPLVAIGDEVIDGRHRLLIAYHLSLPVCIDQFAGSVQEAADRVWSLNHERRQLVQSKARDGMLVRELLLPQAKKEAAERQADKPNKGKDSVSANLHELGRAEEMAVQRSGLNISPRSVAALDVLDNAPQTKELIRSGAIKSVTKAREAALEEQQLPVTKPPAKEPKTEYSRLGRILKECALILNHDDTGKSVVASDEQMLARCTEVEEAVTAVIKMLRGEYGG